MKSFFSSKKPSKKSNPLDEEEEQRDSAEQQIHNQSPAPSPSPSPATSPTKRTTISRAASSSTPRSPLGRSSTSRRKKNPEPEHPLNLPPEERKKLYEQQQRRRLSELSGAYPSNPPQRASMDSSKEPVANGGEAQPQPQQQQQKPAAASTFTVPVTNGAAAAAAAAAPADSSSSGNAERESVPTPPPHRSPSPAEEAEGYKNEGNKYFKVKDFNRAIEYYTKAVLLQPESPTYLSNRAAAYMSAGKYKDALEDCKRAVDLDRNNSKILLRLARIYTSLGQPDEALATFARIQPQPSAKDMQPAREMQHYVAAAQRALKDGTAASMVLHPLDMAEKLLGFGATRPRRWQLMRGEALLKMGDVNSLGEAQNIAMSLLRGNSQDPEALVLRGRALYAQGENDKAVLHFRKAISCDPDHRDAIKWLRTVQKLDRMKEEGNAEFKAGRTQSAIEKYSAALEIDPTNKGINSKLLQNRALCYNRLKQYDQAIADCERAISLDPSYLRARKTKATALGLAEKWEDAVREWKSIQEIEPEDRTIAQEVRKAELELKKSQRKDYYKILGIDKNADENQIKKAYRKLAIVHHPDKNPGDKDAEARFKDISEAYETLSDSQKRARYDSGDDLIDPSDMFGGGGMGGMGGIDPEIIIQMMGGAGGGGAHFGGGGFPGGGFGFGGAPGGRSRPRGGFSSQNFHFS